MKNIIVICVFVVTLFSVFNVFAAETEGKRSKVGDAFAMPAHSPSYPPGPYRFVNREFFIITYETDREALRRQVPEPLEITEALVKFEFIKMPDSSGFGSYTEAGQVIPVTFQGQKGQYVLSMFLDDDAPIAAGREIWGFPKKLAFPSLEVDPISKDTLVGRLKYGSVDVAIGTMGFKYQPVDTQSIKKSLEEAPNYLLKIIPHPDGSTAIRQLVQYNLQDVTVKGAWTGPADLQLFHHALAPVATLPIKRIVSCVHFTSDLTLPYGKVVYDYLKRNE
ncbi:MAG TPA: acetoacetate decarboxylase [Smithellaceae bacterium]|nr:acetoacetate decarboxylase [Smithellaceae bacterium]